MNDFRVYTSFVDHGKIQRLILKGGRSWPYHLLSLWARCAQSYHRGVIPRVLPIMWTHWIQWGDCSAQGVASALEFLAALAELRLVELWEDGPAGDGESACSRQLSDQETAGLDLDAWLRRGGMIRIHDWAYWQPHIYQREERAALARARQAKGEEKKRQEKKKAAMEEAKRLDKKVFERERKRRQRAVKKGKLSHDCPVGRPMGRPVGHPRDNGDCPMGQVVGQTPAKQRHAGILHLPHTKQNAKCRSDACEVGALHKDIKGSVKEEKKKDPEFLPADAESAFALFWSAYPRKTRKEEARKAFVKLWKDGVVPASEALEEALNAQKRQPQWQEPQYIPYPATWLRGKQWEDEVAVILDAAEGTPSANKSTVTEEDLRKAGLL